MSSDVPEIVKTITRKRYVKEKLFNQMLNELCARQCEKEDGVIGKNTEYSNQFGRSNDDDRQTIPKYNFKLYGEHSDAISFWNTAINNGRGHFKQYHPLTKLNRECLDESWR